MPVDEPEVRFNFQRRCSNIASLQRTRYNSPAYIHNLKQKTFSCGDRMILSKTLVVCFFFLPRLLHFVLRFTRLLICSYVFLFSIAFYFRNYMYLNH